MDKMIEQLYEIYLRTEQFPLGKPNKEELDKECEDYIFLCENLTKKMKTVFLDYLDLCNVRHNVETATAFENGFKTAVRLIFGCIKE